MNLLLRFPYVTRESPKMIRGDGVYYIRFGIILKTLRVERGLTQAQLGALVGVTKAVVSKYENAQSYPAYDVLIKMAGTFKVTTDFLLGLERRKGIETDGLTSKQIDSILTITGEYRKLNMIMGGLREVSDD